MKKPKKVNFILINRNEEPESYEMMDKVRLAHHDDLRIARVALAWRRRLQPDKDGHLVLGQCIKVSDLHKEFADYDFIILLNKEVWGDLGFTPEKKLALLDHELCHAARSYDDETGEPVVDERGRAVYRTRKHDIEEFRAIVERHGLYKRDLEKFAESILRQKKSPLFTSKDENTVSFGFPDADGKMQYTEPISEARFSEMARNAGRATKQ